MGILYGVMSVLFAILCIGGAVYLVVYLAKNKDKKFFFSTRNLLKLYLYVISFITLIVAVVGASISLNAFLSLKYGAEFSFDITEPYIVYEDKTAVIEEGLEASECYDSVLTEIDGQKVCFDENTPKRHIVNGLAVAISMAILFILHRIGLYFSEKSTGELKWLRKTYNFLSLIIFSIAGIVTIPIGAYQLLTYIYFRPEDITMIDPPGLPLSLAIFIIPFWVIFLITTMKIKEEEE